MKPPAFFQVGYVARAHGLHGELGIRTFDPESTALEEATQVRLRTKAGVDHLFQRSAIRPANKETLLTLKGIANRTQAEQWVGSTCWVSRDELSEPEEGEYFQGDLVGLKAVDEQNAEVGTLEEVWNTGPVPNLVIRKQGEELVIPFVDDFVVSVDIPAGRIVVRRPEYLE